MDISNIADADTGEFQLTHPTTGEKLEITFTLAGEQHPKRRGLMRAYKRQLRQQVNRAGKMRLEEDPDVDFDRDTDYLVACTLGWEGLDYKGQSPYPYSPENARRLYEDSERAWLRAQVTEALNQQDLFIASSSGS